MTWTRLSDDYSDDTWTLTNAAYRLHTNALVWSNRKLLDGRLTDDDLHRFTKKSDSLTDSLTELVESGFWRETDDGWQIAHHLGYQDSRVDVLHRQEINRKNGARGGRPRKLARQQETHSVSDSQSDSTTHGVRLGEVRTGSLTTAPTNSVTNAHARDQQPCVGCQRALAMPNHPDCPEHGELIA